MTHAHIYCFRRSSNLRWISFQRIPRCHMSGYFYPFQKQGLSRSINSLKKWRKSKFVHVSTSQRTICKIIIIIMNNFSLFLFIYVYKIKIRRLLVRLTENLLLKFQLSLGSYENNGMFKFLWGSVHLTKYHVFSYLQIQISLQSRGRPKMGD